MSANNQDTRTDQNNPHATTPTSVDYPTLRRKFVRNYLKADHAFPGELPPLHLPANDGEVTP